MKFLAFAATATFLFALLAAAHPQMTVYAKKKCPKESDCFENLCKDIVGQPPEYGNFNIDPTFTLSATCKNDKGDWVRSSFSIGKCLANVNGDLEWRPDGGQGCAGCKLNRETDTSPFFLNCTHCPRENYFWTGHNWSRINLSAGIWVKDGVLGCYNFLADVVPL
ncbi:hypothetical protein Cob_v006892 [Colletotrichum orbiculare MAFF 240422]|uniref:Cyanovirin-N domain-containing protein n=2 Tax=Colletotrichum orbiculare species complex TaxID=2707354 RepID=A0A484FPZ8_COLOR|nr:hypothetical protein Cob_v006892 [Colletotrichum orbiculare MAFF 240422]TDZ74760.1 hypothetical protein CTRI78_v000339 [Colletotrichum trifolii]